MNKQLIAQILRIVLLLVVLAAPFFIIFPEIRAVKVTVNEFNERNGNTVFSLEDMASLLSQCDDDVYLRFPNGIGDKYSLEMKSKLIKTFNYIFYVDAIPIN